MRSLTYISNEEGSGLVIKLVAKVFDIGMLVLTLYRIGLLILAYFFYRDEEIWLFCT
jgi:hypothetical protein